MNSIPQDFPLPLRQSAQNKIKAIPLVIGGDPYVQITMEAVPAVAILSVCDAEKFAVQILDVCLATKSDDDPIVAMIRRNLASLPDSVLVQEDAPPC